MSAPYPKFTPKLLAPNYWPLWCLIALWRLTVFLPLPALYALGNTIGILCFHTLRHRRHIASVNIKLCFPHLSKTQQRNLNRDSFKALATGLFEIALAWWASDKRIQSMSAKVKGVEHLEQARKNGQGVLLVGAHYSSLDLGIRFLARHTAICGTYRAHKNPLLDWLIYKSRSKNAHMIERLKMTETVRTLRSGKVVWYAADQDYGADSSVYAKFFNNPAATVTITSRLAKVKNVTLMPFWHHRTPNGYQVEIATPLTDFPKQDEIDNANRINHYIEQAILSHPEQYLWQHRRFKTQAKGKKARPY